jgi:hypothetical protein
MFVVHGIGQCTYGYMSIVSCNVHLCLITRLLCAKLGPKGRAQTAHMCQDECGLISGNTLPIGPYIIGFFFSVVPNRNP